MKNNIIVNADDLGMTPGTNEAIFYGYDNGYITHSSIMTNCDYFNDAVVGIKDRPNLNIGIHLNLTYGKALNNNQLYCNKDGIFNIGYLELIKKSIFSNIFLIEVKKELELQIKKAIDNNINITHIDSHRHIHLIPNIYEIVLELSKKYNISRVRLIKEDILNSLKITKKFNFIFNGGIVKYTLLKLFTYVNTKKGDKYKNISFFSILFTGVIEKSIFNKILNSKVNYEVMIHPSFIDKDKNILFYDEAEKAYRLSKNRKIELETILKRDASEVV